MQKNKESEKEITPKDEKNKIAKEENIENKEHENQENVHINEKKEGNCKSETIKQIKKHQNNKKIRRTIVIIFVILFAITSYIVMKGSYLEYKELGEQYVQEFLTNYKVKYSIMAIIFVFLTEV